MDPSALTRYSGDVSGMAAYMAVWMSLAQLGMVPIGTSRKGKPIYGMAGGDGTSEAEVTAQIADLTAAIRSLGDVRNDANPTNEKAADGGRYAAALDGSKAVADQLVELSRQVASMQEDKAKGDRKAEVEEIVKGILHSQKAPSLGRAIAAGQAATGGTGRINMAAALKASPLFAESFRDYQAGEILSAIMAFKAQDVDGIDVDRINWGKARLAELGLMWMGVPEASKATLGTTNATGGYTLPNNLVDTVIKPKTQEAVLQTMVTVINGVAVRGIDQPYRMGAPARMTFQNHAATKENLNLDYGSYTAVLGTMARIYDISKQYARLSAGAAENEIMDELTRAAVLGENFYMMAGAGGGTFGTGDPTVGVYTSLNATPAFIGYKSAFAAASNATVAGSFANACNQLLLSLAGRGRRPSAIVVDHTTFFTAIGQGSDTAGFWLSPEGGPSGFTKNESGGLSYWGVPIYYDFNLGTAAATKIAIAAEWNAFKLYRGMEFRIDTSDQAGSRWDQNLIGFRGEQEIGFNAESPVHVGAAQLLTAVIP